MRIDDLLPKPEDRNPFSEYYIQQCIEFAGIQLRVYRVYHGSETEIVYSLVIPYRSVADIPAIWVTMDRVLDERYEG